MTDSDQMKDMSKREHFASLAMQALIASDGSVIPHRQATATRAVSFADALIAELNKPAKEDECPPTK